MVVLLGWAWPFQTSRGNFRCPVSVLAEISVFMMRLFELWLVMPLEMSWRFVTPAGLVSWVMALAIFAQVIEPSALWACLPGLLAAGFLLSVFGVGACWVAPVHGLLVGALGVMCTS